MKKRYWLILGIFSLSIIIAGCATRRQVAEAQLSINQLQQQNRQLMVQVSKLDSLLSDQLEASKRLNAELKMSMNAIEERMMQVEQRLVDAGTQFNQAVTKIERTGPKPTSSDSTDTTRVAGQLDNLKLYNAAYGDVAKGNYDMAIKGFEEYLKQFPNTSLADNAVYWIGECYYIEKSYANAQKWYQRLLDEYPKSEHLASAKFKLGMSLYNQKYKTKAKQYFQDVIKDYPGTEEAGKAAEMMKQY